MKTKLYTKNNHVTTYADEVLKREGWSNHCTIINGVKHAAMIVVSWQGAVINGSSFTIHYDTRYWDKPDEFLPERWLDQEGKFVTKKEGFLPFGVGE